MRKAIAFTSLLAGASLLVACSNNNEPTAMDRAEDTVSAGVGQVSANVMGANNTESYVNSASMGDLYEIRSADLALQHGQSEEVKELARMIKVDHTEATEKLRTAVGQAGETSWIAGELDQRRKGLLDNLTNAANGDFDKIYLQQQVAAHEEAIALHSGFADNAEAAQLSAHAQAVLPKIRAHLEKAQELLAAKS